LLFIRSVVCVFVIFFLFFASLPYVLVSFLALAKPWTARVQFIGRFLLQIPFVRFAWLRLTFRWWRRRTLIMTIKIIIGVLLVIRWVGIYLLRPGNVYIYLYL